MRLELVLLCGIPGSGKSTWRALNLDATHMVVSKDRMPRSAGKQARQDRELRAALGAGRPVVLDNTNLTRTARTAAIASATALGVPCRAVVITAPLEVALARNAARTERTRVPEGIVRQMAHRWEQPSVEEGLVEVTVVSTHAPRVAERSLDAADHLPEHPRVVTAPALKSLR